MGADAPPTEAPLTTAPCATLPPQTKLSEETKAMSELEEIDRRGDEPGAEGEGAEVPLRTAMAALHPHRMQSPGRGPPSAPGAWDSPARSLTSARSSLIVAQPHLLCPILHPPTPTGSELIASLYAYRSIARALPTVSGSEANRRPSTHPPSRCDMHPAFLTPTP